MKMFPSNRERLLFRRQFILGPRFVDGLAGWKQLLLRSDLRLTVHPDLPTGRVTRGDASLTLLGYLLDPDRPHDDDEAILRRLMEGLEDGGDPQRFIARTDRLGGRWILLVKTTRALWLFADPAGYREIFYTDAPRLDLWCASRPALLAEVLRLRPDREARAYIRVLRAREPQYSWPGDTSLYAEVRHLLPNRYLDLETGKAHRYWPRVNLEPQSVETVTTRNTDLFAGLMAAAANRFDLALTITAGTDTRTILAASRPFRDQVHLFTLIYWDLNPSSPDVQVPSRLLRRLGLPHHVIRCPSRLEGWFRRIYLRNVEMAHEAYGMIAQGLHAQYPHGRMCVKGNGSAIFKPLYRRLYREEGLERDGVPLDGDVLARLRSIWGGAEGGRSPPRVSPFETNALDRWLEELEPTNVDPLDLFGWENHEANWQAMAQTEWDIVFDTFAPFNCREFLTNMLALPEEDGKRLHRPVLEGMMNRLWPEVLSEPINPPGPPNLPPKVDDLDARIHRLWAAIRPVALRSLGRPVD